MAMKKKLTSRHPPWLGQASAPCSSDTAIVLGDISTTVMLKRTKWDLDEEGDIGVGEDLLGRQAKLLVFPPSLESSLIDREFHELTTKNNISWSSQKAHSFR